MAQLSYDELVKKYATKPKEQYQNVGDEIVARYKQEQSAAEVPEQKETLKEKATAKAIDIDKVLTDALSKIIKPKEQTAKQSTTPTMPSGASTYPLGGTAPVQENAPVSTYAANAGANTYQPQYNQGTEKPQIVEAEQKEAPKRDAAAYEQAKSEQARADIALKGYNEVQEQRAKDTAIMEQDLETLSGWSQEDRDALETYINFRQNGITSGGYAVPAQNAYKMLIDKHGETTVQNVAESWQRYQNEQNAKALAERSAKAVEGKTGAAVLHSLATVPANLLGSIAGAYGVATDLATKTGRYSTLSQTNAGSMANVYSSAVRGQVAHDIAGDEYDPAGNKIEDGGKLRQAGAYAYQGVMSMADSIARSMLFGSGGGAALAASGSFSQAIGEASANGANPTQAVMLGVATAGMEYLTEKIPMDEVFKVAKGGKVNVLGQMFKQAGVEISTEELSLFGTMAAEAAIMREKSSYKQMVGEAIANGASYAEAVAQADATVWEEAKQTFYVSGFSGMASGGGSAIVGNVRANATQTQPQTEVVTEAAQQPVADAKAQAVQDVAAQQQAEVAAQAAQQQEQVETATAPEVVAQTAQQPTVFDNVVAMAMESESGATNSMANTIMNDPAALEQLVQQTGLQIEGTKSEQRKAVKDAINEIAAGLRTQTTETTTEAQQPDKFRQAAQDMTDNLMGVEKPTQVGQQPVEAAPVAAKATESEFAENQNIKGTGAAEQNFSGKAEYQDLLYEGNVQRDRATDARSMEVPKTDANGNPVSEVAANVYGSENTPDDLASEMEEPIARGDFSYIKITNDVASQRAADTIERAGSWENAYLQWRDSVRDGVTGAEMAARGAMLLNHAAEVYEQAKASGDDATIKAAKRDWLNALSDMQRLGTNTAQGLQALRLIRELSPPDKLEFAKATVRNMVADMRLRNDITIDENLLEAYESAETDEQRDAIMSDIQQNVADQIPSTWLDKWNALRYMNMLGNLKTNARNVAGNVANGIMYRIKDQAAALAEDFVSLFNKDFQRTKAHTVSKELLDFAKNDFNNVKSAVNSGGKYGDNMSASGDFQQGVMDKRTVFKSKNKVLNAAMKPLEGYRRVTNWAMNNEYFGDEAFGRGAYARALAGYLKANGITDPSKASGEILDKARAYAIKQAQEATFHDNSALANVVSKTKNSMGIVGEAIMPFTKTPANVLTRAMEFSPLGILDTAQKAAREAAAKTNATEKDGMIGNFARSGENITGADLADSLAKTLTGSALFALGALMQDYGLLRGGPGDDEEEKANELTGRQDYALEFTLNGKTYTYTFDWLTPAAMPMFMGAEFGKLIAGADNGIGFADMETVFTSIGDPLVQMSMLQGINDSLDGIKYSDNNLGQFFLNAGVSWLTQGLTNTLFGQIERSTEENRMTTYIDKESNVPQWIQKTLGKASQKIPGWDYQQMEHRNEWGETEKNEGGLLYNLASPGYISMTEDTPLTNEIVRLSEAIEGDVYPKNTPTTVTYTDRFGNVHQDKPLSQEQYQAYAQAQGKAEKNLLERLTNSTNYKHLTDVQKGYVFDAVYEYAAEQGKKAALGSDYHSSADAWIKKANESDINAFIVRASEKALNNAADSVVESLVNNWEITEADKNDLEQSYKSFVGMNSTTKSRILEQATGDTARYLIARQNGVSTNSYLKAIDNVVDLKPENGKKSVSDAQKYEAIANTKGVARSEIDALMRAYMPDYDPDNGKTEKTEIKYDYARVKMQIEPAKYIQAVMISTEIGDTSLDELKKQGYKDRETARKAKWVEAGFTAAQADELYNLLVSSSKNNPVDVVKWNESRKK